ncbi:MAG TPA: serine hydrolase [Gaiellales bacterium]|nr:serine hydrolase [Gaiellales bacterium]
MQGLPPPGDRVVGVHNWSTYPHLRWGFLHTREIVPTARIERGPGPVLPLEPDLRDVAGITFSWAGERLTVAGMLERTYADGFLVLRGGRVAMEHYGAGMTPTTTHLLQSVSKSIAGTVAGVLAGRGLIDPDAPVTRYVHELAGTSFEGATVRHVLDMRTGTAYDETYDDPASDVFLTEVLAGWRPPSGTPTAAHVYEQITQLGNARPHGQVFDYRSILTELLAWVLERASGMRYPELVSEALWSRIGAEQDADITILHGVSLPDGGVCATLRDMARFGLMQLREGRVGDAQVVPRDWVLDTRHGDDECIAAYARAEDIEVHAGEMYRNQFWVLERDAVYAALGIHGQMVWINVPADVVCVKLSTWPAPTDEELEGCCLTAFAAIADALGDE